MGEVQGARRSLRSSVLEEGAHRHDYGPGWRDVRIVAEGAISIVTQVDGDDRHARPRLVSEGDAQGLDTADDHRRLEAVQGILDVQAVTLVLRNPGLRDPAATYHPLAHVLDHATHPLHDSLGVCEDRHRIQAVVLAPPHQIDGCEDLHLVAEQLQLDGQGCQGLNVSLRAVEHDREAATCGGHPWTALNGPSLHGQGLQRPELLLLLLLAGEAATS
mmetsp:Transcript_34724/g.108405  ORF Transcript_34724/g.108405 Transcript_34724/m.108405 type:complete len:217 (-) Transcript_34724:201-851(-)